MPVLIKLIAGLALVFVALTLAVVVVKLVVGLAVLAVLGFAALYTVNFALAFARRLGRPGIAGPAGPGSTVAPRALRRG
jgi:hypothetical protein